MKNTPIILIAEDDASVAFALETIISREFSCEIIVAEDGQAAWERIKEGGVDIIVSDWNMPNKTGGELLVDVRGSEEFQRTPFLMLTARSDKESVVMAAQSGVSNYISKPFKKNDVIDKVKIYIEDYTSTETGEISSTGHGSSVSVDVIEEIDRCLKNGKIDYPVLPDVVLNVIDEINNQKTSADELARIISSDQSLSAKLINISNSIYFKGNTTINTLQDAIVRLGLNETENYIMMFSQQGMLNTKIPAFEKMMNRLWQHSFASAICAREIAKHIKLPQADSYFTIGLLHDVGKLLLLKMMLEYARKGSDVDEELMMTVFDKHHEKYGGILLKKWGLPVQFSEAATSHHDISKSGLDSSTVLIINLANLIVRKLGYSLRDGSEIDLSEIESGKKLMINSRNMETIQQVVEQKCTKMMVTI